MSGKIAQGWGMKEFNKCWRKRHQVAGKPGRRQRACVLPKIPYQQKSLLRRRGDKQRPIKCTGGSIKLNGRADISQWPIVGH